jgi:hypothetical protein
MKDIFFEKQRQAFRGLLAARAQIRRENEQLVEQVGKSTFLSI